MIERVGMAGFNDGLRVAGWQDLVGGSATMVCASTIIGNTYVAIGMVGWGG